MSRQRPDLTPPRPGQPSTMHLDQIRRISPQDGDVLVLPDDFPESDFHALAKALRIAKPGIKCLIVRGDVRRLTVSDMNDAGWYRA